MSASFFWAPFEKVINTYAELVAAIEGVQEQAKLNNRQFGWRGLVDHEWALHSSLYRRLKSTRGANLREREAAAKEMEILVKLHRWGLHNVNGRGRLSVLNQLAMLQHFGAPTRLIDISFNAWVGVFFAVEEKWSNAERIKEDVDARLFAIDITDRLINESAAMRSWEDDYSRPWDNVNKIDPLEWTTNFYAWKPPSLDSRISAQNGGFIFGGVPSTNGPNGTRFQFPKSPTNADGWWGIDQGRTACCIALRPHKFGTATGAYPNNACYTFRISADAKEDIRHRLELMFGYKHSAIYPDYTGFSECAITDLKR